MTEAFVLSCREWAAAYQNTQEYPDGFWLLADGKIPMHLQGTYFR